MFQMFVLLKGHQTGVTDLAYIYHNDVLLIASTSADEHIFIWEAQDTINLTQGSWRVRQKLHVGLKIQHSVALVTMIHDPSW